jgi:hypothetical protein
MKECSPNPDRPQRVLVLQQNGSGESKIKGIRDHAGGAIELDVRSIDEALPPVLDDTDEYLPDRIDADLVLDFLKHPDLSDDLAEICREQGVPVVASGKKLRVEGTHTPPT